MNSNTMKNQWFGNIKGDVLSGIVVAMALIPEAIAFSLIAGVDPMVGLYASFCIAVVIAFVGGRPGMISAATGATALVMVTLVSDYGLQYLLAATILTGIIQIVMGVLKLGRLMKFVPRFCDDRICKCAGNPYLFFPIDALCWRDLGNVCDGSWCFSNHLSSFHELQRRFHLL